MAKVRVVSSRPRVLRPAGRPALPSVDAVVDRERPSDPLFCLRPAAIHAAA